MSLDHRFPSPDIYREASRARVKLAQMQQHEKVARWYEQEASAMLQYQFAESYRELIGVHPDQRRELREALERVAQGGGMLVEDVLAAFRQRYHSIGLTGGCGPS